VHQIWYRIGFTFLTSAGGLWVPEGPYSPVAKYLLKNTNMNKTVKKKVNFMNSSQNERLSSSCIALSFDGFWFNFMAQYSVFFRVFYSFLNFFLDFQLSSAWVPLKRLN
jgi:hypothetical protein